MRIILASKSPRRRELMNALGVDYEVLVSDMEESWSDLLGIEENSKEIAYQKAKDVYNNTQGDRLILSADTIVVKDGEVFGKPKSREEAIDMIRKLQGGKHTVYTSLAQIIENKDKYSEKKEIYPTDIYVKKMDDYEIIKYVDSYNVYDKAGAYAIQSPFAMYIEKMVGDYYSVVGLPINRVYDILKQNELL